MALSALALGEIGIFLPGALSSTFQGILFHACFTDVGVLCPLTPAGTGYGIRGPSPLSCNFRSLALQKEGGKSPTCPAPETLRVASARTEKEIGVFFSICQLGLSLENLEGEEN